MPPLPKAGHLFSEVYLAFIRRLPCFNCGSEAPSQAHHWPPKGRGVTRDDRTLPVCTRCHTRCHGNTMDGQPPIRAREQEEATDEIRSLFMDVATREEWEAFARDRLRWQGERVYTVAV